MLSCVMSCAQKDYVMSCAQKDYMPYLKIDILFMLSYGDELYTKDYVPYLKIDIPFIRVLFNTSLKLMWRL